ncbi:hypothetical protein [Streptomyces mirabilis]
MASVIAWISSASSGPLGLDDVAVAWARTAPIVWAMSAVSRGGSGAGSV